MKDLAFELVLIGVSVFFIWRAIHRRSLGFTALFWAGAILFAWARTYLAEQYFRIIPLEKAMTRGSPLPLALPLYWTCLVYASLRFAEKINRLDFLAGRVRSRLVLLHGVLFFILSLAIRSVFVYLEGGGRGFGWTAPIATLQALDAFTALFYPLFFRAVWTGRWSYGRKVAGVLLVNPLLLIVQVILYYIYGFLI